MVGVFQFLGVNFLFWTCVSVLRFIFETLGEMRATARNGSPSVQTITTFGGIGIVLSLFYLLYVSFDLTSMLRVDADASTTTYALLALWLACAGASAYLSARMYVHEPYFTAMTVGAASIVFVIVISGLVDAPPTNIIDPLLQRVVWVVATCGISLCGGWAAARFNAREEKLAPACEEIARESRILPHEVAIVIAAHNEELTVGTTIQSVLQFVAPGQVYVGSDGSRDKTVEITRSLGAHADDIQPNRGKAGAIEYVLKENKLLDRYKAVLLMDADFDVDKDFFTYALPWFDNPHVAAIAGHQVSYWVKHYFPLRYLFFTAYRVRLWRILQFCVRYGQTWAHINISPIIPGGCSIYRARVLKHINIAEPGLVIEDFNMTFNVHHKNLGSIVFDPRAFAITQEPFSLRDYKKQTYRWSLGFFQTMRLHGIWPSWFCFASVFFTLELIFSAALFILLPFIAVFLLIGPYDAVRIPIPYIGSTITLFSLLVAIVIFDYITTVVVALIERKWVLLLYGPGFLFVRYLEALLFFKAMAIGLFTVAKSQGKWKSPERVAYTPAK